MTEKVVKLGEKKIRLASNAYSLILYEKTFGRRFLKDYDNIRGEGELDFVNHLRFLWTFAKTADDETEDFETFVKNISIGDVLKALPDIVELIVDNLNISSSKKARAGIMRGFTFLRQKFSRMRRGED